MLKSMTAFQSAKTKSAIGEFVIEISSHNKRALDIVLKLHPLLLSFDPLIRKKIASQIQRGSLQVSLKALFCEELPFQIQLNHSLVEKIKQEARGLDLNVLLPIAAAKVDLFHIHEAPQALSLYEPLIMELLDQALDGLTKMKEREGQGIAEEFLKRVTVLQKIVEKIEKQSGQAEEKQRKKLQERLKVLFDGSQDDERIGKEIALLAQKLDITEELVRLKMHLKSFQETVNNESSPGKKLEFIAQEILREFNTIGSKSEDGLISEQVIEAKCEIEKIREQVMNVE
jgi:uncharacterized protein (TIGR00255 family)